MMDLPDKVSNGNLLSLLSIIADSSWYLPDIVPQLIGSCLTKLMSHQDASPLLPLEKPAPGAPLGARPHAGARIRKPTNTPEPWPVLVPGGWLVDSGHQVSLEDGIISKGI